MIIDVRDYRTVPGKRDQLIERCERELFPEQERLGARVVGSFRDAGDSDRFLFLRGMPDLPTRQRVCEAFYAHGEMWRRARDEVNACIDDSDDVLLVRPIGELVAPAPAPAGGAATTEVGYFSHVTRAPLEPGHAAALQRDVPVAIARAGGRVVVTVATDPADNNYPRHPIRTGEHGLLWFASFPAGRLRAVSHGGITPRRLVPTATSRLR
jgi:hypothetical protein|nr:NIPSNAP family protein [Kofleriaceae bacterium]